MNQHLRELRVYYLALRRRLTSDKLQLNWSEAFVIDWMKTLRVPPRARRRTGAAADALILD